MFQVVVQNDPDTDCSSDELDPAIEEFCSPRSIESYLRAYAMVVGDIEDDDDVNGDNAQGPWGVRIKRLYHIAGFLGVGCVRVAPGSKQLSKKIVRNVRTHQEPQEPETEALQIQREAFK